MNEILEQLRTILATNLTGRGITTFFNGKQLIHAQSDVPMVSVFQIAERTVRSGTVRDRVEYDIGVQVAVNRKKYFDSSSGQGTKLDTPEAITDIIGERETDGDLKTNTVMGILNANLTVTAKVLYLDNIAVQYASLFEDKDFPIDTAEVTFTAYDRPNRT
jgi:hypothetical protein